MHILNSFTLAPSPTPTKNQCLKEKEKNREKIPLPLRNNEWLDLGGTQPPGILLGLIGEKDEGYDGRSLCRDVRRRCCLGSSLV
jgi:hypothetical protein